MYTLSSFQRRISAGGREVNIDLAAGQVRWLGAQEHIGHNTGSTDTRTIFIELKEPTPSFFGGAGLGPKEAGSARTRCTGRCWPGRSRWPSSRLIPW